MRLTGIAGVLASALLVATFAPAKADMAFRLVSIGGDCADHCPQGIVADGDIDDATPDAFLGFVRANVRATNLHSVILLNSRGGKVVASMALGRVFRKVGALTIVASAVDGSDGRTHFGEGRCFSACVYALMGGRKRIVPPNSLVGVHRMVAIEQLADPAGGAMQQRFYSDGAMRDMLARYSSSMGVSRDLITKAEQTPAESIHLLSPNEISRYRLGSSRF